MNSTKSMTLFVSYEVITTPTDIIMVMEYAGGELFNYIVERGKVCQTLDKLIVNNPGLSYIHPGLGRWQSQTPEDSFNK